MKKGIAAALIAAALLTGIPVTGSSPLTVTASAAATVPAPEASYESGSYISNGSLKITLSCKDPDAEIHYVVGKKDSVYKKALYAKKNITISVYAVKDGVKSKTVKYTYSLVPKVTPSVSAGTYSKTQTVKLNCKVSGTTLYYTTDGSEPTKRSAKFPASGIKITETTKLRVLAVKKNWKSYQYTFDYIITDNSKSILDDYKCKWGYNSLDDTGKEIYAAIVESVKTGDRVVVEKNYDHGRCDDISQMVYLENPQFYWFRGGAYSRYGLDKDGKEYYYIDASCGSEDKSLTKKMKAAAKDIVAKALEEDDLRERAKLLHDWLLKNTYYSYDYSEAYGPLVYGTGLCEAYSKAYSYLCQSAGILTYNVIGTGHGAGHMWTLVCIDGKWLHVDSTFDDQPTISYEYFLIGNDYICGDHTIDDSYPCPVELKIDEKKVEKEFQRWVDEIIANYKKGVYITRFYTDFELVGELLARTGSLYDPLWKNGINKQIYYKYYNNWIEIELK
ncbi:MAG: chitobiase/beta-hexosaminidase C-terminal domain-containing protein [Oscillospiraceae bacterium]